LTVIISRKKAAPGTARKLDLTPKRRVSYLYDERTGLPLTSAAIRKIEAKNLAEIIKARKK
jgi:hypothetical protein